MANPISEQTKTDALKIAKSIQKPGQLKEQTKLISQGIEKGIAEYKKQQKTKAREADKSRKQAIKAKLKADGEQVEVIVEEKEASRFMTYLPWGLLFLSWIGYTAYYLKQ
jgi:3'-phosphoadenosine 5'-phosphosulfate (PAPS) 3'-phosphatase